MRPRLPPASVLVGRPHGQGCRQQGGEGTADKEVQSCRGFSLAVGKAKVLVKVLSESKRPSFYVYPVGSAYDNFDQILVGL